MKESLDKANAGWYGVPAPNVGGEREARAAIEAAEELNSPMILDVSYNAHPDLIFLGSYLTRGCWNSFVAKWKRKYKCKLNVVEMTEHSILQYEFYDKNGKVLE